MGFAQNLALVFVAGLVTALATGIGAFPFFFVEDVSDRWNVALWGLASGIMVSASLFGLINEGLAYVEGDVPTLLIVGLLAGVVLVEAADWALDAVGPGAEDGAADEAGHDHDEHELEAEAFAEGDLRKLVLILGILTVHSFPEGVAVGVSFAELGLETASAVPVLGVSVPLLAVFMTVAISVHNVPEGLAISIPMQTMDVSEWRMVGAAVFSSLPQPLGAVIAFAFVRWARAFLPFGFGFAAGAMIYLVATEFIPEALETGAELPGEGHRELLAGLAAGLLGMVPLLYV